MKRKNRKFQKKGTNSLNKLSLFQKNDSKFSKKSTNKDSIISAILGYASSQSQLSAPYVKLSDEWTRTYTNTTRSWDTISSATIQRCKISFSSFVGYWTFSAGVSQSREGIHWYSTSVLGKRRSRHHLRQPNEMADKRNLEIRVVRESWWWWITCTQDTRWITSWWW